jgi:hypothetical protein
MRASPFAEAVVSGAEDTLSTSFKDPLQNSTFTCTRDFLPTVFARKLFPEKFISYHFDE